MKKKIVVLLICTILSVAALASCKLFTKGNSNSKGAPGVIFDSKTNVTLVVCDKTLDTETVYYLHDEISSVTPDYPEIVSDDAPASGNEIVIGESSRDITKKAYTHLSRLEKTDNKQVGYVVYCDGSSIAIVYEQDRYALNAAAITCIKKLTDEFIKGKEGLTLSTGVVCSGFLNPLEYQEQLDEKQLSIKWEALRGTLKSNPEVSDQLADEIILELQNYNAIFNDRVNEWLANLYDPGVGGFYYSNSGRDTEGFLPDIETTQQAIGMVESYGVEVPTWMKKQMGAWVKGLQDPNGYFYHPQWSKTETEQHPNRMGRDLERAIGIIHDGGYEVTYDTIFGHKGDGLNADGTPVSSVSPSSLTPGLGGSAVSAVSKVVSTSAGQGSVPTRLLNKENFIAYLDSLDINGDSYPVGNELATQASQIKARDAQLKAQGVNYSLVDILVKWLNDHQNPETGVWTIGKGIDFEGVNGLLKIIAVYDGVGAEFPHPIEAAKSAFAVIGNGEELGSVCYLYNVWYAIEFIIKNIEKYSTDKINLQRQMNEFRAKILQDAPRAIRETAAGVALFQKPDGSFSFTQTYSAATSQGMRVALQNQYEGDVNASTICINGTANHMYYVLGLTRISPFTKADALELLEIFEELQPVIKDEELINNEPISFSDDAIGKKPLDVGSTLNSSGAITVVKDPELGKYLELHSENDGGDYITVPCNTSRLNAPCFVFEGDFCYTEDCQEGYISQIYMNLYIYMLAMKISDGYVHIWDSSAQSGGTVEQDLGVAIPLGEWFHLRIENYCGSADDVRIKVYVNGELIAVSDNYYDPKGMKVYPEGAAPQNYYNFVMVNVFSNAKGTILMDNLLSTKTSAIYAPVTDDIKINADALPEDERIYDFEDGSLDGLILDESSDTVSVKDTSSGKELSFSAVAEGGSTLTVPVTRRVRKGNCGVFEADMSFTDAPVGTVFELAFREDTSARNALMGFHLVVVEKENERFITLAEAPSGKTGDLLDDAKMPIGKSFKLRIEFYSDVQAALIYVDGELFASSDYVATGARYRNYGLFVIQNVSTAASSFTIDNVKAEIISKSFEKATQPSVDRVTHGFDNGLGAGVSAGAGISVQNGILSFKNAPVGATVKFANNKRSVVSSAAIFEAKINHLSTAPTGKLYEIAMTDADGNKIVSLVVSYNGEKFALYENTKEKTYSSPIATFAAGYETVTIEYYKDKGVINVYVGGSPAAASCLVYSRANAGLDYEFATVTKLSSSDSFAIDYAFAESYNKFYEKIAASKLDSVGTVDFDNAFTSKLPAAFTTNFKSSAAALRIEEAIIKGIASKALAFDTSQGGNDVLTFNLTKNASRYNAFVYETDICIDFQGGDTALQIYIETGSSRSYMLNISGGNGKIYLSDLSAPSGGKQGKSIAIANNNEWFKLRIEYYGGKGFDDTRAKTYINGELVYVSNNYYNSQKGDIPFNDSSTVRYYTYGGCIATIYYDNVSVERRTLECADDELTVDMKPAPKPEEPPVVIDPDAGKLPGKYYMGLGEKLYTYDTIDAVWNGLYNNGRGIYHINYNANGTGLGTEFEENGQRTYIYLDSMKNKAGYTTNVLTYGKNDICTAKGHLAFPETYAHEKGNLFVFETDLYVNSAVLNAEMPGDNAVLLIRFSAGNFVSLVGTSASTKLYDVALRLVDGKLLFDGATTEVETGKWYNLSIETYFTEGYIKIYLDGVCISTVEVEADITANLCGVQLQLLENTKGTKYFLDNTFVGTIYKEGLADADPEVETGNREGGKYYAQNGGYNFDSMSSVWSNLDSKEIIDRNTDSTTADAQSGAFLRLEDVFFNRALCFGKVAADRTAEFYFKRSEGTGAGVVFESAMRLTAPAGTSLAGKEIFAIGFTDGMRNSNATTMPSFNNRLSFVLGEDESYTIGDKTVKIDEWFNLRVEYFDGTVSVYVNGELAQSGAGEIDIAAITHMGFFAIKETNDVRMYLDNLCFGTTDKIN